MKIVLLTTKGNQFAGHFWREYVGANGPEIDTTINLPDRSEVGFANWAKPYIAYRLLGIGGIWQMVTRKWSLKHRDVSLDSIEGLN
jgi:hypothetical protein